MGTRGGCIHFRRDDGGKRKRSAEADPFGTNGWIDSAVTSMWKHIYNDIVIDDAQKDTVVIVVCLYFYIQSHGLIPCPH